MAHDDFPGGRPSYLDLVEEHAEFVALSLRLHGWPWLLRRDMAQDVFLVAFVELQQNERAEDEDERVWLERIIRRVCSGYRRKLSADRSVVVRDPSAGQMVETIATDAPNPEEHALELERRELVGQMISKLKPQNREVLLLRLEGRSASAIALMLEVEVKTVYTRLARACNELDDVKERMRASPKRNRLWGPLLLFSAGELVAQDAAAGPELGHGGRRRLFDALRRALPPEVFDDDAGTGAAPTDQTRADAWDVERFAPAIPASVTPTVGPIAAGLGAVFPPAVVAAGAAIVAFLGVLPSPAPLATAVPPPPGYEQTAAVARPAGSIAAPNDAVVAVPLSAAPPAAPSASVATGGAAGSGSRPRPVDLLDSAGQRVLIDSANVALARGNFAAALDAVHRLDRGAPSGRLDPARETIRIRALFGMGRTGDAQRRTAAFKARNPNSLLQRQLDAAVNKKP